MNRTIFDSISSKLFSMIFIAIVLFGCGDDEQEKKKITGKILIDGTRTPEEAILVKVYPVKNNTQIQKIRDEAPGTGFSESWRHFFSHHDHHVGSATTNSDGTFTIEFSANEALFNLSCSSEKYGLRYIYGVSAENIGEIEMHEEQELSSFGAASFTFESGKSYLVNNSSESSPVTIQALNVVFEAGAIIRFGNANAGLRILQARSVDFNGTKESPIVITSSNSGEKWRQFVIETADGVVEMSNIKVEFGQLGLYIKNSKKIDMNQSLLASNASAFGYEKSDSCYVQKCVFTNNDKNIILNKGAVLKNSIMNFTGESALLVEGNGYESSWTDPIEISNNYINQSNANAIEVLGANISMHHNTINGAGNGVFLTETSWGYVNYNTIKNVQSQSIFVKAGEPQDGSPAPACKFLGEYGNISYNNIQAPEKKNDNSQYAFYHADGGDINAVSNYWYENDASKISSELLKDNVRIATSFYSGNIVFEPYKTAYISDAGAK